MLVEGRKGRQRCTAPRRPSPCEAEDDSAEESRHAPEGASVVTGVVHRTAACFGTCTTKHAFKDALVHSLRPMKSCVQRKCKIQTMTHKRGRRIHTAEETLPPAAYENRRHIVEATKRACVKKVVVLMFGYVSSQKAEHRNITRTSCRKNKRDNTSTSTPIRKIVWSAHRRVGRARFELGRYTSYPTV